MSAEPWLSRLVPGHAPDGSPILSILGKRTYRFGPDQIAILDEDDPIDFFERDAHHGDPEQMEGPLRHETDLVAWKANTDVLVHGSAHAPRGKSARFFDAGIQVGDRKVAVRVFGPRRVDCRSGRIAFSDPEPVSTMPLRWDLAYGGTDPLSDPVQPIAYLRNPLGKGFVVSASRESLHGMALPNLEDPTDLLTPDRLLAGSAAKWREMPRPLCFSPVARHWHPRVERGGLPPSDALDQDAARQRLLRDHPGPKAAGSARIPPPTSINSPQFHNCAVDALQFGSLAGSESLLLAYLDADFPAFSFQLPGDRPLALLDLGEGTRAAKTVLHTVEIHKETHQLTMVWRGSFRYAGAQSLGSLDHMSFSVES